MTRLLVTGGAGFIGSNFVHYVVANTDYRRDRARQAHVRGQPRVARRAARRPRAVRARRHRRRRTRRRADCRARRRHRRGRALRRRVAQRQLAAATRGRSSTRTSSARTRCSRRHAVTASASTTSRPTRSTAISSSTTRRASPRRPPYNPSSPYSSTKAGIRPARAGMDALASGCARRSATARTTTGRTSTSRSSFRARSPTCSAAIRPKLYGTGANVRDWIHADDHSSAVLTILASGAIGETYLIGADGERSTTTSSATSSRLLGPAARRLRPRHRPARSRPALRDRLEQAAQRARLAAALPGLRVGPAPRRSTGTATTRHWWAPAKDATEAKYSELRSRAAERRAAGVRQGARACIETAIPGLLIVDLPVHGDNRGWFKENWQREKMTAARPARLRARAEQHLVQRRRRHDPRHPRRAVGQVGVGRHRAHLRRVGRPARGADVRGSPSPLEIDPSQAIFVPRGVGNAYQTLEPDTAYTYLVNDHWSPDAEYPFVNLADETVAIDWPIPLDRGRALGEGPGAPAPRRRARPSAAPRRSSSAATASSGARCAG